MKRSETLKGYYQPPDAIAFERHLNRGVNPPLNVSRLSMDLLVGDERQGLRTPTTGDMSFVVRYKDREGYVASFGEDKRTLSILQLQGGSGREGYRVTSGLHVIRLLSYQLDLLLNHPENPYEYLIMPPIYLIQGVIDAASELAVLRYEQFARSLKMRFDDNERRFKRELKGQVTPDNV